MAGTAACYGEDPRLERTAAEAVFGVPPTQAGRGDNLLARTAAGVVDGIAGEGAFAIDKVTGGIDVETVLAGRLGHVRAEIGVGAQIYVLRDAIVVIVEVDTVGAVVTVAVGGRA